MTKAKKPLFKWGELSDRQYTALVWWKTDQHKDKDGIICDGSIRSGKTVSMAMSFVLWAMATFNGQDFAMCGKTVGALRRNVTNTLKKQIKQRRGWYIEEKRSDNLLIVRHGDVENNFYLFGGKDEGSQDLIQGLTLAGVFFDEVALMPESFVNQATGRCSVDGSKYWFNCNPSGPLHWFKQNWINKCKQKNLLYLHFTMDDNLTLSQRIRERYEKMYTGVFYKRYILGLWVAAEGLIYDMFDRGRHVVEDEPRLHGDFIVSVDYGIQNATVFLYWAKTSQSGERDRWECFREWRYSGREERKQKTVQELVDGFESALPIDDYGNVYRPSKVIVDPSASALIVELRKRGCSIRKANNDVVDGIADVQTALLQGIICFHSTCKDTLKEFSIYSWDSKKADKGKDEPVKEHDHSMDAVRYFVKTMKLVKRNEVVEEETNEYY